MKTYALYFLAALAEIAGCFAFWAWLRLEKPVWWLAPGIASLIVFAWLLALVPSEAAGRTYAAYGAIYILASILWLWVIEARVPDRLGRECANREPGNSLARRVLCANARSRVAHPA